MPETCTVLPGFEPDRLFARSRVFPANDGWTATSLVEERQESAATKTFRARTVRVSASGILADEGVDVRLTHPNWLSTDFLLLPEFATVGEHLVVTGKAAVLAIEGRGAGPGVRVLAARAPLDAIVVPIDATRFAAVGLSGDPTHLELLVADVESGAELGRHRIAVTGVSLGAQPWPPFESSVSLAAISIDETVLIVWVGATRRTLDAVALGLDGSVRGGVVSFSRANTDLYQPRLARVARDRVGAVWTGDSGLEVRYRTLPIDLAGVVPTNGTIVNATRACSQEYANIAADPRGDGALVVWGAQDPQELRGRFVSADEQPVLDPPGSDLSVGAECSRYVSGLASLATSSSGTLASWSEIGFSGPGQIVIRRVDAPH